MQIRDKYHASCIFLTYYNKENKLIVPLMSVFQFNHIR